MTPILLPVLLVATALPAPLPSEPPDDIVFDVYRNDTEFGHHAVRFGETPSGALRVDVDIELTAGFGPVTVFRYEHEAEEVWQDGRLVELTAATLKDGDWTRIDVEPDTDATPDAQDAALAALMPSSHWRGYSPATGTILNTETGEPMAVEIEDLGMERIATETGEVEARHIRMTGTLQVDLWYDEAGRWVGCRFEARGQSIRYVLQDG